MRLHYGLRWLCALPLIAHASAFPGAASNHHDAQLHQDLHKRCPYANHGAPEKIMQHEKRFLVDSMKLPVDVTGVHVFQPPNFEKGDQRGPCPGLNALANHGYIPRNGVVSFAHVIQAINKVYGMGIDLATVLAIMGTVWTGDPLSLDPRFSIGGRSTGVNNLLDNLGGLLGEPQGLIGSHNFIEADSSNTRDDIYVTGNNYVMNMDKFMSWYNMSTDGTFDMNLMALRAKNRFDETIKSNPNFYYGPVTGLIARNAGYIFPGRLFRNHSADNPEGVLTKSALRNFYAVYGEENNLTYKEGWEQIPSNWYKTPVDYGLVQLNLDIVDFLLKYPELGSVGGNTGKVNSFAGVDLADLTGGLFNATNLLKGNSLLCFAFEVLRFASPNALSSLYSTLAQPLAFLGNILATPLLDITCPAMKDLQVGGKPFWQAIQDDFPGAKMSGRAF
ncbi:Chloroperoxidase domain-containing protein [Penicillium ucsense]|uniref:Chloroperoxidase domain-containing protein n=1 Tax=Penicillium ucsense TaxID=2839758 RepID=A0A8J8W4A9_9EURO|nr:Chloroperoxidase domain-containing protein [Penicillium ucsense]KAF7737590.1 Chloroperoxidase domain-containing protein [Penicillium ucsense]